MSAKYIKLGSPPHTWRILYSSASLMRTARITSTHVENTTDYHNFDATVEDHLHTRGEYLLASALAKAKLGSPPHTWRILCTITAHPQGIRITSTHVENTVNKSQYNNNHKTIDPKITSLCQLLLYLFLSH